MTIKLLFFHREDTRSIKERTRTMPQSTMLQSTMPQSIIPQSSILQSTVTKFAVPQSTVLQSTMPQLAMPQSTMPQSMMPQQSTITKLAVPQSTVLPQLAMPHLQHLERKDGKSPINIIESIGTKNIELGTLLLNDDRGNIMDAIKQDKHDTHLVTREILRRWLNQSKDPSWKVLIDNLVKVKLETLARQITEALETC